MPALIAYMGVWGFDIYESDVALDFVARVEAKGGARRAVLSMLERAAKSADGLEGRDVVAAAEMIAAAAEGVASASGLTFEWKARPREIELARRALLQVARESEAAFGAVEAGAYAEWLTHLDPLYRRLGGDRLPTELPERAVPPPLPTTDDHLAAAGRLHAGVFDANLVRGLSNGNVASQKELLRTLAAPLAADTPALALAPMPELTVHDVPSVTRLLDACGQLDMLSFVLAHREKTEAIFYTADLFAPIIAVYAAAAVAGRRCETPEGPREPIATAVFAEHVLSLAALLGGDRNAGLLSLVSDRTTQHPEVVEVVETFGRGLAFVLSCTLWAAAFVERAGARPRRVASVSPLLVAARLVLRLRQHWSDALDEDAPRRIAAWGSIGDDAFGAMRDRVWHAADWLTSVEQAPPSAAAASWKPGLPVLTRASGVSVVLAAGEPVHVAGLGFPRAVVRKFPRAALVPLAAPPALGVLARDAPDERDLHAEQDVIADKDLYRTSDTSKLVLVRKSRA